MPNPGEADNDRRVDALRAKVGEHLEVGGSRRLWFYSFPRSSGPALKKSKTALQLAVCITLPLFTSACTGKLDITDDKGKSLQGIPITTYELWIEEGTYSKLAKGGDCDSKTPFQKFVSLPTGPVYYIKVEGSLFAKTSLNVKLNADGALSELSFNSESNLPDTFSGAANVLKAVPTLGVAGAGAPLPGPVPACDTGEVVKKVTKFDEWKQAH
jgi:hypothetical protein